MSGAASTSAGWIGWLTTDTPRSRLQARAVSLYQGWRILSAIRWR